MLKPSSQKVIQIPLPAELLDSLSLLAQERGDPLEVLVKEACAEYVASARDAEMDREYIEFSGRSPGEAEEATFAKVSEDWPAEDDWG